MFQTSHSELCLQDYLRSVAKVRREFSDVLADDGGCLQAEYSPQLRLLDASGCIIQLLCEL